MADPGQIDPILADGADRARALAAETMEPIKDIVGFIRRAKLARAPRPVVARRATPASGRHRLRGTHESRASAQHREHA